MWISWVGTNNTLIWFSGTTQIFSAKLKFENSPVWPRNNQRRSALALFKTCSMHITPLNKGQYTPVHIIGIAHWFRCLGREGCHSSYTPALPLTCQTSGMFTEEDSKIIYLPQVYLTWEDQDKLNDNTMTKVLMTQCLYMLLRFYWSIHTY